MSAGTTTAARADRERSAEAALRRRLTEAGLDAAPGWLRAPDAEGHGCPVLDWAASGAMALTGWPGEPAWPDGDVIAALGGAGRVLTELAGRLGRRLAVDPGGLLCSRAAFRPAPGAGARRGTVSFGGHCRLLPTGGDWLSINLSRPDDVALLPALSGGRVVPGWPADDGEAAEAMWAQLADEVGRRSANGVVKAARELGLPASVMGEVAAVGNVPWSVQALGAAQKPPTEGRPLVADFTALWAGPLCAHLLARSGACVVTVESTNRPDGARLGDPGLHADLHSGHHRLAVDFDSREGQRRILDLVSSADVVLEASRPRALGALGIDAAEFVASSPGRTWVSITGYGRNGPQAARVAFGDDAAVAGGLVGRDRRDDPVFCADAIADPTTGVLAAVAALASVTSGGGHLVDCSMAASSAFVNRYGRCGCEHRVERSDHGWTVFCDELGVRLVEPWTGHRGRRVDTPLSSAVVTSGR